MKAARKIDEKKRIAWLLEQLEATYGDATCELTHKNPFELLVATILSAQCTDKRVNMVTPVLFGRFPGPAELAVAKPREIEAIIRTTGFFRNKTKSVIGASRVIMEDFNGKVPRTMDELLTLPGVARKTANVVLGTAFGMNEGIVVDTHVRRLSNRLGLTRQDDPVKIEQELITKIPREQWTSFAHRLIWHGRRVCVAQKPRCEECPLAQHCPSAGAAS